MKFNSKFGPTYRSLVNSGVTENDYPYEIIENDCPYTGNNVNKQLKLFSNSMKVNIASIIPNLISTCKYTCKRRLIRRAL